MKLKLGQPIQSNGTIFHVSLTWSIRVVYQAKDPAYGEEAVLFHWEFLNEKGMQGNGPVGWYTLEVTNPAAAGQVTKQIDELFANSSAQTRTETERAFQAGFVSMY